MLMMRIVSYTVDVTMFRFCKETQTRVAKSKSTFYTELSKYIFCTPKVLGSQTHALREEEGR